MKAPRYLLSTSLPLTLLVMGLLAIGLVSVFIYVSARNGIFEAESNDTADLTALAVGQLSNHLKQNRLSDAKQVLESIRFDRSVTAVVLVDENAKILLSSPYQPPAGPLGPPQIRSHLSVIKQALANVRAFDLVSKSDESIVAGQPVFLSATSTGPMQTQVGLLILHRNISQVLANQLGVLIKLIFGLSALLVAGLLGLWQFLRKILFVRMRKLVSALESGEGVVEPAAEFRGLDELSQVSRALHDFTLEQQENQKRERQMLDSLHQSEQRYRSLFMESPDAILVSEQDQVTMANQAALDLFGIKSDQEILGRSQLQLFHSDCRDTMRERFQQLQDFAQSYAMVHEKIVRPDGEVLDVEVSASSFQSDGKKAVHIILRDISERLANDKELIYQRNFLKATLESTADGIVTCDAEGKLVTFNRTAKNWHMADVQDVHSDGWQHAYDLFHADGETPLAESEIPLARAYQGEEVKGFEMVIAPRRGKAYHILANARQVIDDEGTNLGAVVSMRDITQQKAVKVALQASYDELERRVEARTLALATANARLQELDRLKSMFIASMSHELRTPMNSIIGFTGLLLMRTDGPLNETQEDYCLRVKNSAKLLLGLITDVIDVSKIEAGKINAYFEQVNLAELADEALSFVRPEADAKGLTLKTEGFANHSISTDKKRLMQCLLNYLSNAVKFTPSGEVILALSLEKEFMKVSVTDTGVGIAKTDADKLFKQFSRVNTTETIGIPGTGLGLYLTSNLVRQVLRGEVGFHSNKGAGSTFWLTLPREVN